MPILKAIVVGKVQIRVTVMGECDGVGCLPPSLGT